MGDTIDKADAWDAVVKARAEGIAQGRAEGFRAGAEAALARIAAHRDGSLSIEEAALLNVLEDEIRRAIPEEHHNG